MSDPETVAVCVEWDFPLFTARSTSFPNYAPATRFLFLPVMVVSGLWMWKGHRLRRLVGEGNGHITHASLFALR